MEGKLKISKVEYLRNHWLDLPQILNLISKIYAWNEDDYQWKMTSNIKSWISQKLQIESSSIFEPDLRGPQ